MLSFLFLANLFFGYRFPPQPLFDISRFPVYDSSPQRQPFIITTPFFESRQEGIIVVTAVVSEEIRFRSKKDVLSENILVQTNHKAGYFVQQDEEGEDIIASARF